MQVSFKQGTRANFDALTSYTAGAFYILTDEGSAFLALSSSSVKRLGNFVELASTSDLPTGSAKRVEGLYYVKADNAFYRWDTTSSAWSKIGTGGSSFEPVIVTSLPSTGDSSKMYLIQVSETGENRYDKYIWLESTQRFDKVATANATTYSDETINTLVAQKLSINAGTTHAGQFVVVGEDGLITYQTMETWEGGDF